MTQSSVCCFFNHSLAIFLFSICMLSGISMTSAVAAGVIMASIPACVAVMSWLLLRERVGMRVWIAVACAVPGIALISLSKNEQTIETQRAAKAFFSYKNVWLGSLLVFYAVLCESAYAVIGKNSLAALALSASHHRSISGASCS
jgi:drug/metabolite transporter (DMT)-like permease